MQFNKPIAKRTVKYPNTQKLSNTIPNNPWARKISKQQKNSILN